MMVRLSPLILTYLEPSSMPLIRILEPEQVLGCCQRAAVFLPAFIFLCTAVPRVAPQAVQMFNWDKPLLFIQCITWMVPRHLTIFTPRSQRQHLAFLSLPVRLLSLGSKSPMDAQGFT